MNDIPERLSKFPFYKGYLVHYTVYIGDDNVPDFRTTDEAKRRKCMENEWCFLCGQPLTKPMIFIGGPISVMNRVFHDGPMHDECAKYAVKVCPYLSNPNYKQRPVDL